MLKFFPPLNRRGGKNEILLKTVRFHGGRAQEGDFQPERQFLIRRFSGFYTFYIGGF
jgi:hypothetical protein